MGKKVVVIILLILLIPPIGLTVVQLTETYDFLDVVRTPVSEVLAVENEETRIHEYMPQMCTDGDGGVILTWMDNRTGDFDIYAQRIDKFGSKCWTEGGVAICVAPDKQGGPEIIATESGGAIILWANGSKTWPSGLYAQKINADGQMQWDESGQAGGLTVASSDEYQDYYHMIDDGIGGAIIAWHQLGSAIVVQHIASEGTLATGWPTEGLFLTNGFTMDFPQLCTDMEGGAIVTWEDARDSYNIYAQRVSADGDIEWDVNGTAVCTAEAFQTEPKIASDGDGGAIIAWGDRRGIYGTTSYDIYALRLDGDGDIVSGWDVNGTGINVQPGQHGGVQIIADGHHGAVIAWVNYTGDDNIAAQRVDGSGNLLWDSAGIDICSAPADQYLNPIAISSSDQVLVPWVDYRNENTTGYDLYGQLLDLDGNVLWDLDGRPIAQENGSQTFTRRINERLPMVVPDETGDFIIGWYDARDLTTNGYDVYVKRVIAPFPGIIDYGQQITSIYGIGLCIYGLLILITITILLIPSKNRGGRR